MVVGKEAVRVRNTVERASKIAHSIVFIDELDALGKSRGGEVIRMQMRSDDEAEQTPNQLLAWTDGLDFKKGVWVSATTNRRTDNRIIKVLYRTLQKEKAFWESGL